MVEICGPFYQIANFFFFYAGILHDVAFIRTCVVLGFLFITAYLLYGTPAWPQIWEPERAFFRMDSVFWMILALVVNVVPLLRCLAKRRRPNTDDQTRTREDEKTNVLRDSVAWFG